MNIKTNTAAVLAIATVALPTGHWLTQATSATADNALLSVSQTTNEIEKADTIDTVEFDTKINELLSAHSNLDISISITDITTGKSYQYGDAAPYTAASVTKLITASLYLHEVESGQRSLNDTIGTQTSQELIEAMIINSDNTAWHTLNDALTKSALEAYASSLGMSDYDATDNIITSNDLAILLTKLQQGTLLDANHSELLLSYMEQASEGGYIQAAAISDGAVAYHKAGWLTDRLHDAAIINDGDHSYVLVIFSKASGVYDFDQGTDLFQAITKVSDTTFLRKA